MLIRSQDRKSLINLDHVGRLTAGKIYGKDETGWLIEVDRQPFADSIGQYSTEAKAIKVLNMITNVYVGTCYTETEFNGMSNCSVIIKNNVVFEMPTDEGIDEPTVQDIISDLMKM